MKLLFASVIIGIIAGMDIPDVADAVQIGVGNALGNVDRGFRCCVLVKIRYGMIGLLHHR
jgi:H+/gluconate symporter-like permease